MSGKQFNAHCRIYDYVEKVDPELAKILYHTCANFALNNLKGKPGVTFLMPQDKAFVAKLSEKAYSMNGEEVQEAANMLNALVIRDVFKTPAAWLAHKDDIPNSLTTPQHVEIKEITKEGVVIFKSGAEAILDKNFTDSSRNQNLAVWILTKGTIPVTTDKPATLKYAKAQKGKSGGKSGGYTPSTNMRSGLRYQIALAVENAYAMTLLSNDQHLFGGPKTNIFIDAVLRLIGYLKDERYVTNGMHILLSKVIPLISCDYIDFYILLEPHKQSGDFLLDDSIISGWWQNRFNVSPATLEDINQMLQSTMIPAACYVDRAGLVKSIAQCRSKVNNYSGQIRNIIDKAIQPSYEVLESENRIGNISNVYPEELAAYYRSNPGLKMMHDELRFVTFHKFCDIEKLAKSSNVSTGDLSDVFNLISECLHAETPQEVESQRKLLNQKKLMYLIGPTGLVQEIQTFVNSTMFLFIAMTADETSRLYEKSSVSRPQYGKTTLYNIQQGIYETHKRVWSNAKFSDL